MSANVTRKRNMSEAFADEENRAEEPSKRPQTKTQAGFPICQLSSSSIHPPERPEIVLSSLANQHDDPEDTQEPELYTYKPLGLNLIRLLRLHPGQWKDAIYCSLVTDSILSPSSYEAISYVWGERYPAQNILLSDEEPDCSFTVPRAFLVTPNLYDVLRNVRRPDRPLVLWVDALCIDQANSDDKHQQIALMSKIYSNAHRVLVWLGDETTSTAWAVSNLSRILSLSTLCSTSSTPPADQLLLAYSLSKAFLQFCDSEWFKRTWTIQEISLARRATFIRGPSQVDKKDLEMAMDFARQHLSSRHKTLSDLPPLDPEPLRVAEDLFRLASDCVEKSADGLEIVGRKNSLFQLITQVPFSRTTDPRDRIYALLGLAKPYFANPISANYNRSVFQACRSVVSCEINASQSLDVLMIPWAPRATQRNDSALETVDTELVTWHAGKPSWIPFARDQPREFHSRNDLSRVGTDFIGLAKPFAASRDYLPEVHFEPRVQSISSVPQTRRLPSKRSDRETIPTGDPGSTQTSRAIENNVLVASGIEIGTITDLSMRMAGGIVSPDCLEMAGMSFSEGCEALQNKSTHVWERLWRILVADRNKEGLAAPTSFRLAFFQIFKQVLQLRCIDTEEMLKTETNHNVLEFLSRVQNVTWDRRMFSSRINHYQETLLGLAPREAQVGDRIVILFGGSVPMVIRVAEDVGKDYSIIIGETYVHGKMHGEAFNDLCEEALAKRTREFYLI